VLRDRVRVRLEVRFRSIMFICTIVIKKYKQKMAILWYISIALQFLNKVLKVYEVNKCQNNCLVYH